MVGSAEIKKLVLNQKMINQTYGSIEFLSDSGVFSVVFTARRIPNDSKTVLKFFLNPRSEAYRQAAFEREGRILWNLLRGEERFVQLVDPPQSMDVEVTSGDVGFTVKLPFLALDWMNGGDAESLSATLFDGRRDLLGRLDAFREMVRSVARLHFLKCFHRDLKPGNFLFENAPEGRKVKLSDFGTIRFCDGSPPIAAAYQSPVGDLRYAAPELFSAVDVPETWNKAADLYSLGAILFELLTSQQLIGATFGSLVQARDFHRHMSTVAPAGRLGLFHSFLDTQDHVLPRIREINPLVPRCIADHLDEVIGALTEFDYRTRTIDLTRVVRLVDISRTILANEDRYLQRLSRRRVDGEKQ